MTLFTSYEAFEEAEADRMAGPRTWADDFRTYSDACRYYGAETPEMIAAEDAYYTALEWQAACDDMEARGGPVYVAPPATYSYDDIPF